MRDLDVGCLECVLAVEGALTPGRFTCVVGLGEHCAALVGGLADRLADSGFRVRIGVDGGSGHTRAAGPSSDADRRLLPAQAPGAARAVVASAQEAFDRLRRISNPKTSNSS